MAVQSEGKITVSTECFQIGEVNDKLIWDKSSSDPLRLDEKMELGFEVRDTKTSFELPFIKPKLASGDDIVERCGPIEYKVTT